MDVCQTDFCVPFSFLLQQSCKNPIFTKIDENRRKSMKIDENRWILVWKWSRLGMVGKLVMLCELLHGDQLSREVAELQGWWWSMILMISLVGYFFNFFDQRFLSIFTNFDENRRKSMKIDDCLKWVRKSCWNSVPESKHRNSTRRCPRVLL